MELPLYVVGPTPMIPNVRPGDVITLVRVGRHIMVTATPMLLSNILLALRDGSIEGPSEASPEALVSVLRELMADHPLQRVG